MHFVVVLFVCVVQGVAMASGVSHHAQQSHAHRAPRWTQISAKRWYFQRKPMMRHWLACALI